MPCTRFSIILTFVSRQFEFNYDLPNSVLLIGLCIVHVKPAAYRTVVLAVASSCAVNGNKVIGNVDLF